MPSSQQTPITAAHRQAAFERMGWTGWSFERAMADPVRSRVVECRARQIAGMQARSERLLNWPASRQPFPSYPSYPAPKATNRHTPYTGYDCKRAAAGDTDQEPDHSQN